MSGKGIISNMTGRKYEIDGCLVDIDGDKDPIEKINGVMIHLVTQGEIPLWWADCLMYISPEGVISVPAKYWGEYQ